MPDIAQIIASNSGNAWLYLPAAVLLGALHALEPGHAKSVMAAFIVAIRGTPAQAVLLGVSAAIGHTIVVWLLVLLALHYGDDLIGERAYPWLVLASGLLILVIALRLLVTVLPGLRSKPKERQHQQDHHHDHDHDHNHSHDHGSLGHRHMEPEEIEAQYANRVIKPWEIAWFGFTGGLMPCPAAIAVLLVALKLKAVALGAIMVGAFSLGLAITLVAIGIAAAWGVQKARGIGGFDRAARILPVISVAIVGLMGLSVTIHGLMLLRASA